MKKNHFTSAAIIFQSNWAFILAFLVAIISAWISIYFASQPLLENHGFRQTQTALTAYWIIQDGWKMAYETPVGGYPWSIPFEFPIYQSIVAFVSVLFHFQLDATGRLVSFCFLLACAWPAWSIVRRLKLNNDVAWIFCALLWSSPLYLFWGRTFMIETTAVFFTFVAISYSVHLLESSPPWISTFIFAVFATLGMLQKVTTAAPVLLVIALVIFADHLKTSGFKIPSLRKTICTVIALVVPFIVILLWTNFADHIKLQNTLGAHFTSKVLSKWNYGSLAQRIELFSVIGKIVFKNSAGVMGILIIAIALYKVSQRIRTIICMSLVLFVLPILIFSNLHIVHDYYFVSSTFFFIGALAISIGVLPSTLNGKYYYTPIIAILVVCCNLLFFHLSYGEKIHKTFVVSQTRELAVGDVIQRYTSIESGIVVFGADWSGEIAYYSKRKTCTFPANLVEFESIWKSPASYLGNLKLGAVVFIIDNNKITPATIFDREDIKSDSCLFRIDAECYIWLPGVKSISSPDNIPPGSDFYSRCIRNNFILKK
jgi:hypothetical protein